LIKNFLKNEYAQLISLAIFSLFPICFTEQLEGAGLAESFGTIFIILLIWSFLKWYQKPYHIPTVLLTSFVWSLTVMASPASAYLSVFIFLTFLIKVIRKERESLRKIILYAVILTILAIGLSSIYWGNVIKNHGLALLIESFISQHQGGLFIFELFIRLAEMNLLEGEPVLSLLFIVALCVLIYFREYEFTLLSFLSVLIPREKWIMGIIGVLMIGYALDLIFRREASGIFKKQIKGLGSFIIYTLIISVLIIRPFYILLTRELITDQSIDEQQIAFLLNINKIWPSDDKIVIIGNDEFLEWAPYLTERTILNVWYGTEFAPSKSWIYTFNDLLQDCESTDCISQLIREEYNLRKLSLFVDLRKVNKFLRDDIIIIGDNKASDIYESRFVMFALDMID
jgi:hypothetical protein